MAVAPLISIVSPVFKAEEIVDELVRRIKFEVSIITENFEIILVEDGSPDGSWDKIEANCLLDERIRGIKLSRNFGQHNAIRAGVDCARGNYVVLMDCDLQDDPSYIAVMYEKAMQGFEIVFTRRIDRKHSFVKAYSSVIYNLLLRWLSSEKYIIDMGSLVLFSKKAKVEFQNINEQERLYVQLLKWIGFKSTIVEVDHKERYAGVSSYKLNNIIRLGVSGMIAHSDKLLSISIFTGFTLSLMSFLSGVGVALAKIYIDFSAGWPSVIISIFFSTGLILSSVGILGIYLGKIFNEVKKRPLYIVDKSIN